MSRDTNQNEPSTLLSDDENRTVFTVLGARRLSKATAVVQMFHAHPNPSQWTKHRTGVVCFVKDNMLRSYFIRLVDINSKTIVYEQELYDQFRYKRDRPCFHSYPGDKFTVGLNFASEDEADKFGQAVESKINYVRRATMKRKPPGQDTAGQPTAPVINRPPVNVQRTNVDFGNKKQLQKKGAAGGKPKKLTKADIGLPTDFRHLAHVGWDPSTGAFDSSNINPEWRKLLDTVGVTEEQLKDKDTANFIYDFVEKRGGIEKATQELENSKRKPPPPPSHRDQRKKRGGNNRAPPAPPQPRDVPPAPPHRGGGNIPAPPPPPPIGVPAPPPPPPVASGGGGPPPPPSRSGGPPSKPLPRVDDARSNLLASIRQGKQLKSVTAVEPEEDDRDNDPELDGMAGALQRALALRQNAIHGSDSDNDEGDEDDDDEEDWD